MAEERVPDEVKADLRRINANTATIQRSMARKAQRSNSKRN